jgi:hypothetical protein
MEKTIYAVKKVSQLEEGRVYERLGTVVLHANGTSGVLFLEIEGTKHELALFVKKPWEGARERAARAPAPATTAPTPAREAVSRPARQQGSWKSRAA